jgi:hypothetical protein
MSNTWLKVQYVETRRQAQPLNMAESHFPTYGLWGSNGTHTKQDPGESNHEVSYGFICKLDWAMHD